MARDDGVKINRLVLRYPGLDAAGAERLARAVGEHVRQGAANGRRSGHLGHVRLRVSAASGGETQDQAAKRIANAILRSMR